MSEETKTTLKVLNAQRKYDSKEEVKKRKRQQYLKKRRKDIPSKINKLLEDFDDYTEEDLRYLYEHCDFIIKRK
jgi:cell division protein FtsB